MGKWSKKNNADRIVINMLRPSDPEVSLQIAKDHEAGKTPNLDQGLFNKDECKKMWQDAEDGKGVYPGMYDPVKAQLGKARGALFALPGQPKKNGKEPAGWSPKLGKWFEGATLGDFRLMHDVDIHKDARIVEGALVALGKHEYIVGTDGEIAPNCIQMSKTGNYSANERMVTALSLDGDVVTESGRKVSKTELNTLVGQINNAPILLTLPDGRKVAHLSNQTITWGHQMQGDKALTPNQFRALKGDDKGTKFVPLPERWVGRNVGEQELVKAVLKEMKTCDVREVDGKKSCLAERYENRPSRSTDKEKQQDTASTIWANVSTVQTRDSIASLYCYGYRQAAGGKPIGRRVTDEGTMVFVVIGGHGTHGLSKTKWQVNAEAKTAAAAPAEKKTEKAAAAPKKSEKKSGAKKGGKKATTATTEAVPTTETDAPVDTPTPAEEKQVEAEALGIEVGETDAQVETPEPVTAAS